VLLSAGTALGQSAPIRPAFLRYAAERAEPRVAASSGAVEPAAMVNELALDDEPAERPYDEAGVPKYRPVPSTAPRAKTVTADPAPADWGNIASPRAAPTRPPVRSYVLVPAAEGVVQPAWGDTFDQSVLNPEETFHHGPVFCPSVELDRPDGLAPIGVFGDHTLEAGGQLLISYRYNATIFDGNRDGKGSISTAGVLADFPIAPTHMWTQRHTALMEYGVTDDLTLLALLPFQSITIDQVTAAGTAIDNANTDPGDVIVQALYIVWRGDRQQVHLNLGLEIPLGLQESERFPPTPDSPDKSYPLRTSSGTYDFMPGATYRGQNDDWTWGAQGIGTIRFGINNFDYKLGNRLELTAWLARRLSENLSLSFRLDGNIWANIFGADPRLNQLLVPTNRPDLQGGRRLDVLFGMNLYVPGDYLHAQWFSVEGGLPAYQSLFGPQLETDWTINAGYNLRF
jgi:hypothetical protein